MGTPDFAVDSLRKLVNDNFMVVGVVTSPDKPAGRGLNLQESSVKKFALESEIPVLQPHNLKDENFIDNLRNLDAQLFVVVAFRMLPEIIWSMPEKGTINLHASLLPEYRGAAPINWAIINGEEKTGVTTFFLRHEIDTGNIIQQVSVNISEQMNAGDLHDILMEKGSELLTRTIKAIIEDNFEITPQSEVIIDIGKLKKAPKIFKEDCRINWNKDVKEVYNFIRGLSPYPGAFTEISDNEGKSMIMKIFSGEMISGRHESYPGKIITDNKTYLFITTDGGLYSIRELQVSGKKQMKTEEFLRGNDVGKIIIK